LKVVNAELLNKNTIGEKEHAWYLMDSGVMNGCTNMALDEYLATQVELDYPLLRFYQWQPFTISLGYNQRIQDIELEKCRHHKIDVVRRPTGGRAVLHAEEVTYAVIIPKKCEQWFQNSIRATYNFVSLALVEGLSQLGIAATLEQSTLGNIAYAGRSEAAIPCFSASAQNEVMFQHRKLIGSAQRRFEKGILQHGSVLVGNYHLKLPLFLNITDESIRDRLSKMLDSRTISISQILDHPVSYREVVDAFITGFSKKYQIGFLNKKLTPRDLKGIEFIKQSYQLNTEVIP
jgi:lipoate-protein ligase A